MAHSRELTKEQKLYFSIHEKLKGITEYILENKDIMIAELMPDGNHLFAWQHFIDFPTVLGKLQLKMQNLLTNFKPSGKIHDDLQSKIIKDFPYEVIDQQSELLDRLWVMSSEFVVALTRFYPNGTKKADFNPKQLIPHLTFIYQLQGIEFSEQDQSVAQKIFFDYCCYVGKQLKMLAEVDNINKEVLTQLEKGIKALKAFSVECAPLGPLHPQSGFFYALTKSNYLRDYYLTSLRNYYSPVLIKDYVYSSTHHPFLGHTFSTTSERIRLDVHSTPEAFGKQFSQVHEQMITLVKRYTENIELLKEQIKEIFECNLLFKWKSEEKKSLFVVEMKTTRHKEGYYKTYYKLYLEKILPYLLQEAMHLDKSAFSRLLQTYQSSDVKTMLDQLKRKMESALDEFRPILEESWASNVKQLHLYDDIISKNMPVLLSLLIKEKTLERELQEIILELDQMQCAIINEPSAKQLKASKKLNDQSNLEDIEMNEQSNLSFAMQVIQIFYNIETAGNVIDVGRIRYQQNSNHELDDRKKMVNEKIQQFVGILETCRALTNNYMNTSFSDQTAKVDAQRALLSKLRELQKQAKESFQKYEAELTAIQSKSLIKGSNQWAFFQQTKRSVIEFNAAEISGPGQ